MNEKKNEVNKNDKYIPPARFEPGMSWLEGRCTNHYTNGSCWQR